MKSFKLSRPKDHRTGLVKNLATSLIVYERIITTLPKAKLVQSYTERLINRVKKTDAVNGYRLALAMLQTEKAAQKMLDIIKSRFASTDGGFTRIIKLSPRHGDNALRTIIELTIKTEQTTASKKIESPQDPKVNPADSDSPLTIDKKPTKAVSAKNSIKG